MLWVFPVIGEKALMTRRCEDFGDWSRGCLCLIRVQ
ncbi:unnamed protein product [Rhodiola kirilowii]